MTAHRCFSFGDYTLDLGRGALLRAGVDMKLRPKSFAVLRLLVERHGELVTKRELLDAVWGRAIVTEGSISQCLIEVRRAIGDNSQRVIRTVPRRGYIFDAPVVESDSVVGADGGRTPPPPSATPAPARATAWRTGVLAAALLALAVAAVGWVASSRTADTDGPPGARTVTAAHNSIAVLPFVDMTAGQDQRFLSDGISEEIINRLAQAGDLRVISRSSSFAFRDRPASVSEIADRLDVSHVLEGSVRRSGNRVRITAQLIAAADDSHVWSETYDRELGDLLELQDEIAATIATALGATLTGTPGPAPGPASYQAYERFLQGEFYFQRRAPGDPARAIESFEAAVASDPGFARGWAALAAACSLLVEPGNPASDKWRARQREAALKAVELDPRLAVAQARLAQYYWETSDLARAEAHYRQAVALDPEHPLLAGFAVSDAISRGDFDAAISVQRRALARDPVSPVSWTIFGALLLAAERLDEAMSAYRRVLEINPDGGPEVRVEIVRILVLQGRYDAAASAVAELPAGKFRDYGLALLYRSPGREADSVAALERLAMRRGDAMDGLRLAEAYAFRGMVDEAFSTLGSQRGALARDPITALPAILGLQNEMRMSPFLASLHEDPRWAALLAEPGR